MFALPALCILACSVIWRRGPWVLIVVVDGTLRAQPEEIQIGTTMIRDNVRVDAGAILSGVLAQLPLTLLNALVVTVAVA